MTIGKNIFINLKFATTEQQKQHTAAEIIKTRSNIGRTAIKAFNTLFVYSLAELGRENGEEGRLAMQVAGDDEKEKEIVMNPADPCGFDPYDAGTLAESWKMQPTSAGYCCDYTSEELKSIKKIHSNTGKRSGKQS